MKQFWFTLLTFFLAIPLFAQSRVVVLQNFQPNAISDDAQTSAEIATLSNTHGIPEKVYIILKVREIATPNADQEIDFVIQTSYDGSEWVDTQNIHYNDANNGSTDQRLAIIDGAIDGPGVIKSITGTDPVAGLDIFETVPANAIWQFEGAYATLVTGVGGAARQGHLHVTDGTNTVYRSASASTQAASLTNTYTLAPTSITATVTDDNHWIPTTPGLCLSPGWQLQLVADTIQVTDDWSAMQLFIREWHDDTAYTDGTIRDNIRSYNRPVGTHIRVLILLTGASAPSYRYEAEAILIY